MSRISIKIIILLGVIVSPMTGQCQKVWNNKKCAVVLTYDDALNVHLDYAVPQLDSMGLRGTFYLSAFMPGCSERINDWRLAAKKGHELGNHTMFHPCIGGVPGRMWVTAERDLNRYTADRFVDEIRMTNVFLKAVDGKTRRTFAYTCGDTLVENQSVIARIKSDFVSARGVKSEMISRNTDNLYNVGAFGINGESSDHLIALVKEAMRTNSAVVFLFHGVGGEHALNVGLKEHRALLRFLKENSKDIWVAPFIEVTEYIKSTQAMEKKR